MADFLRSHRHRRRPRRLRRGDPRGAARDEDRHRRARAHGGHLLQLGLHPDQGAAAHGRDLWPHGPRQGLRAHGREGRLRHRRHRQALAPDRGADEQRRPVPHEEEQGRHHLGRGDAHRPRTRSPSARPRRSRWSRSIPPPKNALGEGVYKAKNIIIATGARPRVLPGIEPDGDRIWTYFEAMVPKEMPKSLLVMGSGAIGMEFASFYRSMGAEVTVIELLPQILPVEDAEIAAHVPQAVREARHQGSDRRQGHQGREDRRPASPRHVEIKGGRRSSSRPTG